MYHEHDHAHTHHEGEETCTDPTHHHHPRFHHEGEEFCTDPTHHHHHSHTPFRRAEPKVGRNEPCHCGSGKKFKKCHGA